MNSSRPCNAPTQTRRIIRTRFAQYRWLDSQNVSPPFPNACELAVKLAVNSYISSATFFGLKGDRSTAPISVSSSQ